MHERLLIKGGNIVAGDGSRHADILVVDGKIEKIAEGISADGARVFDASDMIVTPGLVDIDCHLREPGQEYRENIATGTAAAARGGFSTICCMADTEPVNDTAAVTAYIQQKAREAGPVRVFPIASLTQGMRGELLTEAGDVASAGAVALSDCPRSLRDANRMRLGLSYAKRFGLKIISHAEDVDLTNGGVMNEGYWSTALGLPGATRAAEDSIIYRDCLLAQIEDTSIHFAHVSTRGGVEIIRDMKRRGVKVTAETAPHYIYATDKWLEGYDTNTRTNPPLREEDDRNALIDALADGTIDCIASDHSPLHIDDKNVEFAIAASGVSSFETAFAVCWTALVKSGKMSAETMIDRMTASPARVLGLDAGKLVEGGRADISVFDVSREITVDASRFVSLGKNTPFDGMTLTGAVKLTVAGGVVAFEA